SRRASSPCCAAEVRPRAAGRSTDRAPDRVCARKRRGGQAMIRSIEDEGCSHFERRMLANYGLDEVKLRRLGYFFLVHSHIDTKLIALVVKSETVKLGQHRELAYDDHALLSRKWSRRTFKLHL